MENFLVKVVASWIKIHTNGTGNLDRFYWIVRDLSSLFFEDNTPNEIASYIFINFIRIG